MLWPESLTSASELWQALYLSTIAILLGYKKTTQVFGFLTPRKLVVQLLYEIKNVIKK